MTETTLQILIQGAPRPNCAEVVYRSAQVALISIDMHSKRHVVDLIGKTQAGVPMLFIAASEGSVKPDESKSPDECTQVAFPDFVGWDIWCAESTGRYGINLTLRREEEE